MKQTESVSPSPEDARTAVQECDLLIKEWGHWADRNRRLSLAAGLAIVVSGTMIPVCIVVSAQTGAFAFGKLIPSLLGALAAAASGAVQIVRPHDRWRILDRRRYLLQAERMSYVHRLGDYSAGDPDRLLLDRVVAAQQPLTDEYQTHVVAGASKNLDPTHRAGL